MLKKFWDKVAEHKVVRYFVSGVAATLVDYGIYEILVLLIFKSTGTVGIAAAVAGIAGVLVAYWLHKNITWRDRDPGKYGPLKFVIWNILIMVGFRPILATGLTTLTGLYEWAFGVCQWLNLPFNYEFVMSTGLYVLMTVVTAIINFIFYERVVFGEKSPTTTPNRHAPRSSVPKSTTAHSAKKKPTHDAN